MHLPSPVCPCQIWSGSFSAGVAAVQIQSLAASQVKFQTVHENGVTSVGKFAGVGAVRHQFAAALRMVGAGRRTCIPPRFPFNVVCGGELYVVQELDTPPRPGECKSRGPPYSTGSALGTQSSQGRSGSRLIRTALSSSVRPRRVRGATGAPVLRRGHRPRLIRFPIQSATRQSGTKSR